MKISRAVIANAVGNLLFAAATMAQANPMQDCRNANESELKAIQAQYQAALDRFQLLKPARDQYNAMLKAFLDSRDGSPTLAKCKAKTQKLAEMKATLTDLIAKSDPQLAACRKANNEELNRVGNGMSNAENSGMRVGVSPQIKKSYTDTLNNISAETKKAEARGFTMADCKASAARIATARQIVESICMDADPRRSYTKMECIKVQ